MQEVRLIDANALKTEARKLENIGDNDFERGFCWGVDEVVNLIESAPTLEAEPVRHGRWIECDYKHMEHGMIETEPKAGLYCSECRAAFRKKKMTYKQYCAACGARMDATDTNVSGKGGADNG